MPISRRYLGLLPLLLVFFTSQTCKAQRLFQFYYNFMNPLMMDAEGYAGHSTGFNGLTGKFGFEVDYGKSRKVHENRYTYINPQMKFLLGAREESEVSKYTYLTLGMMRFVANKDLTFTGRGENLQPPYWDTMEAAQTYNEYHLQTKWKTTALQIGIERVTEKHLDEAWMGSYVPILNPVGMVVGWFWNDAPGEAHFDFTRTFRFSVFAAPPNWLQMERTGFEPAGGKYLIGDMPKENIVTDPTMKNLVGCRMGWLWTSLKPVGSSFGIEMTMLPGVFSIPGVYGRGFPDDNIYIKVNLGLAIGGSEKN